MLKNFYPWLLSKKNCIWLSPFFHCTLQITVIFYVNTFMSGVELFTCKECTADTLFNGELLCSQHQQGYRFSVDAILAAHFLCPEKGAAICDIGTGCGIIPLILLYRHTTSISRVDGIEVQPQLKQLAANNIERNGFAERSSVIEADIRQIYTRGYAEKYQHFICNPPYYKKNTGRTNQNSEALKARHQIAGDIKDFAAGAAAIIKNRGTGVFVYPATHSSELFAALAAARLEPKKMQYIYSSPGYNQEAKLVLVESRKNGGTGLRVLPPFYIYKEHSKDYSAEMARLYAPNSS